MIWTFFLVLVCGTYAQWLSTPFSYTLYTETNEKENRHSRIKHAIAPSSAYSIVEVAVELMVTL
jgi:hypothetical protein